MTDVEKPYLEVEEVVVKRSYNPDYGDKRACKCGHLYYRHFDTYDDMYPIGCKYCGCRTFNEAPAPVLPSNSKGGFSV